MIDSLTQVSAIFLCLESILLYIASSDKDLSTTAHAIRQRILVLHLPCVYWLISMQHKSTHIKAGLRLLVAMAVQDGSAAREVLHTIDWGHKVWAPLLQRTDIKVRILHSFLAVNTLSIYISGALGVINVLV